MKQGKWRLVAAYGDGTSKVIDHEVVQEDVDLSNFLFKARSNMDFVQMADLVVAIHADMTTLVLKNRWGDLGTVQRKGSI